VNARVLPFLDDDPVPAAGVETRGEEVVPMPASSGFKTPRGEAAYMAAYEESMRLWTVPYQSRDLPSRFGSTHLVACGPEDGPPLVLLHCFFTSLTTWAYNVAALSQHRRVYALDVMGQPSKSVPDQPITSRDEMAEWLTATLDGLGLQQADLVGYSFGGFAALDYAIHAPDRVGKLVLLSPVGGVVAPKKQFYVRGVLSAILPSSQLTTELLWFNWFFHRPNLANQRTRLIFDRVSHQFTMGLKHFRLGPGVLPTACTDDELRGVRAPTLLLVGRQEALYDAVSAVARAEALIPDVRAELIADASHDLPISQPEAVNRRVLAFLEGHTVRDAGDRRPDQPTRAEIGATR
jgi:pimeloyl-ACP methyl ester carboxylesterase